MLKRREAIFGKIETVYGKDASPSAANDAIFVENLSWSHQPNMIDRPAAAATIGTQQQIYGGHLTQISFDCEMKGSGSLGVAPEMAPALRACGLAETVTGGVSVEYDPISTGFESATFYYFEDGTLRKLVGCRGNISFNGPAKERGMISITLTGHAVEYGYAAAAAALAITLDSDSSAVDDTFNGQTLRIVRGPGLGEEVTVTDYVGATKICTTTPDWVVTPTTESMYELDGGPLDIAFPSPTYDSNVAPEIRAGAFTIGGYSPTINSLSFDLGNTIAMPPDWNSADGTSEIYITGRDVAGSIDPEKVLMATKNYEKEWKDGTTGALDSGFIGKVAGNLWRVQGVKVYTREIAPGDRDGLNIYENGIAFAPSAGDDDIKLTFA